MTIRTEKIVRWCSYSEWAKQRCLTYCSWIPFLWQNLIQSLHTRETEEKVKNKTETDLFFLLFFFKDKSLKLWWWTINFIQTLKFWMKFITHFCPNDINPSALIILCKTRFKLWNKCPGFMPPKQR